MFHGKVLIRPLLCVTACFALFCSPGAHACAAGEKTGDLCRIISGGEIADAIDGRIIETKSQEGRCVYIVEFKKPDTTRHAFVIYQHEADDYDDLRDAMEGEIKHVQGTGDEAVISFDGESGRYWLVAVKRGEVTYQVSGDNEEMVRKIALTAVQKHIP